MHRLLDLLDVRFHTRKLQNQLIPVLSADAGAGATGTGDWAERMMEECRDALAMVLPFTSAEHEFLDRLLDHGEIRGDVLGLDGRVSRLVQQHPALNWKAHHARGR